MDPQYKHDCPECIFVGSLAGGLDVYAHPVEGGVCIVERHGPEGPNYTSETHSMGEWLGMRMLRPAFALGVAFMVHRPKVTEPAKEGEG